MNKDRQIVSELRNFFTENGCGLDIQRIMNVLGTINITEGRWLLKRNPTASSPARMLSNISGVKEAGPICLV